MLLSVDVKKLKSLRLQKNYTQHQLALKAGLSGNAIQRLESGSNIQNRTNDLRIKAIAKALKVCYKDLLFTDNEG